MEGVFHGEQQLSIGITQHQLDLPLLFRELQLSVQGIIQSVGKDGGEHDLVYPQGFQIQGHMECNTGLATLAFEICKNVVEGIILAVATKGCGFHLGYIAGDQLAGVLQIVLIDTQGQIAQQQPHIVAQEAGFQIAFPDGFQFLCLLLNRDFDDPVLLLHLHFRFVFLVVDHTKGDKHHAEEECQKIGDQTGLKRPPVGIDIDGVIKQIVHERYAAEKQHAAGIFGEELGNQTGKIVNNRNGYRCRDDDPHDPDQGGILHEGFCQQAEPFGRLTAQVCQENRTQNGNDPLAENQMQQDSQKGVNNQRIQLPHPLLTEKKQRGQLGKAADGKNSPENTGVFLCQRYAAKGSGQRNTPEQGQRVMGEEKNGIDHKSSAASPKIIRKKAGSKLFWQLRAMGISYPERITITEWEKLSTWWMLTM